eukprot:1330490-Rhodomonas_salina.1
MEQHEDPLPHIGRDAAPDQTVEVASKQADTAATSKWCNKADAASASRSTSKWCKILAAGTPEFVPVKRYSVAKLLSLRQHASAEVEIDVHHIENSIVSARQRTAFQSPLPIVEPLFMPLFVPCQRVKQHEEHHKDSDSARSSSPTIAQTSSEDETEVEQEQPK